MSEELIVRQCAPTLAGMKTGNLFSCHYESMKELQAWVRRLNCALGSKGLRVIPLRCAKNRALIYVYRPAKLNRDLKDGKVNTLLKEYGYPCGNPGHCVAYLASRLRESEQFPHEIGLFLGYPPEDVQGFIEHHAECSKCSGCWKVYGDEQQAQKLFAKYKKCTEIYHAQWSGGKSIEQLTVAV